MKNSFYIDLQRFMLIPTKFPLSHNLTCVGRTDTKIEMYIYAKIAGALYIYAKAVFYVA